MLHIMPTSDLKENFAKIQDLVVDQAENVYLTQNGYGSMVVMSLEKYSKMIEKLDEDKEIDVEKILKEMDEEIENPNVKYLTHDEVFDGIRRRIDGR